MKKWSLRTNITLLVGLVVTLACLSLTVNSISSARGYYSVLDGSEQIGPLPGGGHKEQIVRPDQTPYSIATQRFSIQNMAVMAAVILLSVLITYRLTGRLLRPLTTLTSLTRAVDQEQLHHRLNELPGATGEVRELSESFNGMLDRLEGSFRVQKNFAASAAHELKTPLAVLKTSLQVLELDDHPTVEDYQDFIDTAQAGVDRLIGTVDALMALAGGADSRWTEPIAIRPLLDLIFSELETRAEASNVTLALSGNCPDVPGDQTLLYQALFNLVENAVKYNRSGGRVEVTLSEVDGHARIQVLDTGIGMPQEAVRRAFEPFYRADESRSQKIPGAGLGLSVVKNIVDRHGGEIELESTEGVGTTVTLILS